MTRYTSSRSYFAASVVAVILGLFSAWVAVGWAPAWIPVALFGLSATALAYLATRPPIEIWDDCLATGDRRIPWTAITAVDRNGWGPLVIRLGLADGSAMRIVYPGDLDSANSLLRHVRRLSTAAMIDGVPYRQFWGDSPVALAPPAKLPSPRYRLLRHEDEAEVERLYLRLKTVGHLDSPNKDDEK